MYYRIVVLELYGYPVHGVWHLVGGGAYKCTSTVTIDSLTLPSHSLFLLLPAYYACYCLLCLLLPVQNLFQHLVPHFLCLLLLVQNLLQHLDYNFQRCMTLPPECRTDGSGEGTPTRKSLADTDSYIYYR